MQIKSVSNENNEHKISKVKKGKAVPLIGHGGPQGYQTSRLPYFLDSRLIDGDKVVRLMTWLLFTSGRSLVSVRG
jgi:hypothetical protein